MTEKKDTLCAIPWAHINIIPRGKVYHCCMNSKLDYFVGDLNKQSIEEVWNSDNMKEIRKAMLNGERHSACSKCYESEDSSGGSQRINQNRYFKNKIQEIPEITKPDGHVEKIDLKYWDFRFSNLCNYKCRTCGPEFSSAWLPDAKKIGWASSEDTKTLNIESVNDIPNVDFLKKHLHEVEKVYFAGGEPLLMDEHWQILDMLDKEQKYNVILTYNSNLSTLEYKNKNVLDYWKKWGRRVWLWPSIDDIDERAELIRSGTNWKNVEKNLKALSSINIHVRPSITVSAMNAHRIPFIINRLIDIGVIKQEHENWQNFSINVVEYSPYFHVSVLPDNRRIEIRAQLEEFISEYQQKYNVDIRNHFLHLFWHLEKPWDESMLKKFKTFTEKIDEIRDEKTIEIIPELKGLLG